MSHTTAQPGAMAPSDDHGAPFDLSPANTTLPAGGGRTLALFLMGLGVGGLAIALFAALGDETRKHALAAYHIGVLGVLAASLGAMFFVLIFHLTMAGWSTTIRRQFENVMLLAPLAGAAVLPLLAYEILSGGCLFAWLNKAVQADDVIFQHKAGFLNPVFFTIRALVYVLVWAYLAWKLWGYSTEQDRTGDRWISNKARFTSSWGMLAFALTVAFASFDWVMSLDYRFFSTMWGVYFFAGCAFTSLPVVVLILAAVQRAGKLKGLVTDEHYHDLGKLMFGFTVFWAYIAYCQYMLIWYANIPEETFFMLARKTGPWLPWTLLLSFGHFILPFFVLLWRFSRRASGLLAVMAVWAVLMEIADLVWIVRPLVYAGTDNPIHPERLWIDIAGIGGVWFLFAGLLVLRVYAGVLIPTRDPRLGEALQHRNYV